MLAISEIFGDVEERPVVKAKYGLPKVHELVREAGTLGRYGEVWHHDCSYMTEPPLGALLYGIEVNFICITKIAWMLMLRVCDFGA